MSSVCAIRERKPQKESEALKIRQGGRRESKRETSYDEMDR